MFPNITPSVCRDFIRLILPLFRKGGCEKIVPRCWGAAEILQKYERGFSWHELLPIKNFKTGWWLTGFCYGCPFKWPRYKTLKIFLLDRHPILFHGFGGERGDPDVQHRKGGFPRRSRQDPSGRRRFLLGEDFYCFNLSPNSLDFWVAAITASIKIFRKPPSSSL